MGSPHAQEVSTDRHRITLGATRELLLPTTLFGCFALYYLAEQPFWMVLTCAAPMMCLYALSPLWAARSMAAFDRDSVRLLASRAPERLRARYARSLGMRLFAPAGAVAERKGMMLLECGSVQAAHAAYSEALDELGTAAADRVVLGAAHASFAAGDDAQAIALYRRVLEGVGALPGVERKLAHALVRRGEELDEALALLKRCESPLLDAEAKRELQLMRALAHAKLGQTATARELLARVDAPHGRESTAVQSLRAAVDDQLDSTRP
jgi:tetratricopeptide (TPR) repeat protein